MTGRTAFIDCLLIEVLRWFPQPQGKCQEICAQPPELENIKWPEKVTNEQVLDRIGDKKTLLNTILRRKANFIGRIQRCH